MHLHIYVYVCADVCVYIYVKYVVLDFVILFKSSFLNLILRKLVRLSGPGKRKLVAKVICYPQLTLSINHVFYFVVFVS